jgi:hypothetical protein
MSIRRVSLLSGFAALAMLAAGGGLSSASAAELRKFEKPAIQLNKAPTTQTSTSFAIAKKGDALSSAANDNLVIQDNTKSGFGKGSLQVNTAPTTQTAKSFAYAKKGNAFSDASNTNTVIQNNFGGRFQVNHAPTHQSAHSGAVAIGGTAVSSASNSNVVSQGNVR